MRNFPVQSAPADNLTRSSLRFVTASLGALALLGVLGCERAAEEAAAPEAAPAALSDEISQASYSLGYTVAENMKRQFADSIKADAFLVGFTDGYEGTPAAVTEEQASAALQALATAQQTRMEELAKLEQQASEAFLAENAAREGVVALPSGLQYEVLTEGDGPSPKASDVVTTHYHGTLIDGTVFDSSVDRDEPASFPLDRVIPGWTEALQLMKVGSKWKLFIPPRLAYGNRPAGTIPANSALIFEVELLGIEPTEEPAAAADAAAK